jgi:hypothetical protein
MSYILELAALKTPPPSQSQRMEIGTFPEKAFPSSKYLYVLHSIVATFSPLAVRIGPSIDQSENTDFCGIGLDIASPSGQQFAPVSTTYYDNLNIPAGVTGSHIITYTFSGSL